MLNNESANLSTDIRLYEEFYFPDLLKNSLNTLSI